jgi:putative FmdB family regulatory protein
MPIYAYRCAACGHSRDVLQKLSDAPLTTCPACGAEQFSKQVTAAGFQLKGSGWYVTDFKNKGGGAAAAPAAAATPAKPSEPSSGGGDGGSSGSGSSGAAGGSAPSTGSGGAAGGSGGSSGGASASSCGGGCACH